MERAAGCGESIVTKWSLAPRGVRIRATKLLVNAPKGRSVAILKAGAGGLMAAGAWLVALVLSNGRRALVYAEDNQGQVLADWSRDGLTSWL
jgi:hypothetical protein